MSMNLMYSPLETIFEATMEREGRTVTSYTSGNQFQAFMRRNDDGNNYEDRITLFYSINAPIIQGSLISYGNKIYILVNRETEENHCYYKSSALACNGMITLNDGSIVGIPCYGSSMKDGLIEQNNVISMIDGNMEFITESNSLSRKLDIGNTFNEFGRTWKIDNIYYKDGILHIIAEVYANEKPEKNLRIFIDGLTQEVYNIGDTIQLTATPYMYNAVTTGTFTWESTDSNVATIDGEGSVTFVANGSVAFKAYWVEENFTEITNVVGVGKPVLYTATLSGTNFLRIEYTRTLSATVTDKNGIEVDGTWEFEVNFEYPDAVNYTITGNKIKLSMKEEKDEYIGKIITVTATDTTHEVSATMEVEVVWDISW